MALNINDLPQGSYNVVGQPQNNQPLNINDLPPDSYSIVDHNPLGNAIGWVGNTIKNSFQSGINQIKEGEQQGANTNNPFTELESATKIGAGAINAAFSPLAPVFAPVSAGINAVANKVSDIPAVQNFASSNAGDITSRAAEDVNNLSTIGQFAAGLKGAPEAVDAVSETAGNVKNTINDATKPINDAINNSIPSFNPTADEIISKRTEAFNELADRYPSTVGRIIDKAQGRNIDPISLIAKDDNFIPEIDKEGSIDSSRAIANIEKSVEPIAKIERQAIEAEGVKVSFDKFANEMRKEISDLKERGSSYETISSKIESDIESYRKNFMNLDGTIDLAKIDDIKNAKYGISNYMNEDAQIADKSVAAAARKTIIDNTKNADVKALNDEMSKYYTARDFLEKIDGKKIKGGRLGKYFAQTIGGIAGSKFGPAGTLAGAAVADKIQAKVLQTKFNPLFKGDELKTPTPEILTKTQESLNKPPVALSAPIKPEDTISGKVFDKYNSLPNKQGGFLKIPSKIHYDDLGTLRDFTDYVNGSYKPSQQAIIDLEIAARRIVEKYGITDPEVSNRVLATQLGKVLDAKLNLNDRANRDELGRFTTKKK